MRQHPIPQNILDVEFKLFTKFTLKEFIYLAIGIGFGGLMIYLVVSGLLPAIIGIPIAILTSLAGIVLGLVPINDQDADVFMKNYISAITSPTQRVWMNRKMKEEGIKTEAKPVIEADLAKKPKIIGGFEIKEETPPQEPKQSTVQAPSQSILQISSDNISKYQFNISNINKLPGNINLWISGKDNKPIPNVVGYLRNKDGKILYANKTGVTGYFLTNRMWTPDIYIIDLQHSQYKFPKIQLILSTEENKLPIKITNI